jgi:hypothetical protein
LYNEDRTLWERKKNDRNFGSWVGELPLAPAPTNRVRT